MKQYQGEKAIISLTSWKARIKTVGLTIFNLLEKCPGFHIVLVLSEEEFPRKEDELPEDLRLMSECNKIEILWVYKNYKAFKKVLFTMDKYRDVPVISADDDCIYTFNYADFLYKQYIKYKTVHTINGMVYNSFLHCCRGPATIYPPGVLSYSKHIDAIINFSNNDDLYIALCLASKNIKITSHSINNPFIFHDTYNALGSIQNKVSDDLSKMIYEMSENCFLTPDGVYGHFCKELGIQYQHPLVWTVVKPNTFSHIIDLLNDFDTHSIEFEQNLEFKTPKGNTLNLKLNTTDKITFLHIIQNKKYSTPKKVGKAKYGGDIYVRSPNELIKSQFIKRLARFKKHHGEKAIVIYEQPCFGYTQQAIQHIIDTCKYRILLVTSNKYILNKNVTLIKIPSSVNNDFSEGRTLRIMKSAFNGLLNFTFNHPKTTDD